MGFNAMYYQQYGIWVCLKMGYTSSSGHFSVENILDVRGTRIFRQTHLGIVRIRQKGTIVQRPGEGRGIDLRFRDTHQRPSASMDQ